MQESDFTTSQGLLIVGGILAVIVIITLGLVIARQQRKIQELNQPKYGFLGKPLVGALATAVMILGTVGAISVLNQDTVSFDASADQVSFNVQSSCNPETVSGQYLYDFVVRPRVNPAELRLEPGDRVEVLLIFDANTRFRSEVTQSYTVNLNDSLNFVRVEQLFTPGQHTLFVLASRINEDGTRTQLSGVYNEEFQVAAATCNS